MSNHQSSISYWDIINQDPELQSQLQLIEYPRLAAGLKVFPYKKGLAILGVEAMENFEGFAIRKKFAEFLPQLDGKRSINDLLSDSEDLSKNDRQEIIANLFLSGFLRSGPLDKSLSTVEAYFDHVCGYTLVQTSGKASLTVLNETSMAVMAPTAVAQELQQQYQEITGKSLLHIGANDDLPIDCNMLIIISVPGSPDPAALFAQAQQQNCIALNVEISNKFIRLGPLILPHRSASYPCYIEQYGTCHNLPDSFDEQALVFWSSMAMQNALNILSGSSYDTWVNSFVQYQWINNRQIAQTTTVARIYGWNKHGETFKLPIDVQTQSFIDWQRYNRIALQSIDMNSPKAYHNHYKSRNIKAIHERIPIFYTGLTTKIPDTRAMKATDIHTGLNLYSLSTVLQFTLGFGKRLGMAQRFCPTGGGLGSTLGALVVNDLVGLESGVYWYDSQSHLLEHLPKVSKQRILGLLGVSETVPVLFLSVANTPKVAMKYGPFSYNISWYDAGVLFAYVKSLTDVLGIKSESRPLMEQSEMLSVLGLEANGMLITGIYELTDNNDVSAKLSSYNLNIEQMLSLIKTRYAKRDWTRCTVTTNEVNVMTSQWQSIVGRFNQVDGITIKSSILLLLKLSDGQDGFYQINDIGTIELVKAFSREQHYRILSQKKLSEVAMILLPTVDLAHNLDTIGDLKLDISYRTCGAIVGDLWLHSKIWGMAGSACGGVFEGEVRSVLGQHSLSRFSPLSLCLGPVDEINE